MNSDEITYGNLFDVNIMYAFNLMRRLCEFNSLNEFSLFIISRRIVEYLLHGKLLN